MFLSDLFDVGESKSEIQISLPVPRRIVGEFCIVTPFFPVIEEGFHPAILWTEDRRLRGAFVVFPDDVFCSTKSNR